jgi:hypothetical protein
VHLHIAYFFFVAGEFCSWQAPGLPPIPVGLHVAPPYKSAPPKELSSRIMAVPWYMKPCSLAHCCHHAGRNLIPLSSDVTLKMAAAAGFFEAFLTMIL